MNKQPSRRDIIVIGASAGGLEPLRELMRRLPGDLQASIFVVVHMGASSHLAQLLNGAGTLPVGRAKSGEQIEKRKVYVAAPGTHLLLHHCHILLRRGPRENFSRPAIDPLFRSAAINFGGRVIGVVLSGNLNDGTAGLLAIKHCGGLAVVQDPTGAAVTGMPESALRHAGADYVADAAQIAGLLARLSNEPAGPNRTPSMAMRLETLIAAQELTDMDVEDKLGKPSRLTCPECHGSLWEIEDGSMLRYRCHTGHGFTAESVLAGQSEEVEKMMESLLRSHQERAELARRMAEWEHTRDRGLSAQFQARAKEYEQDAKLIRGLLRSGAKPLEEAERETDSDKFPDEPDLP